MSAETDTGRDQRAPDLIDLVSSSDDEEEEEEEVEEAEAQVEEPTIHDGRSAESAISIDESDDDETTNSIRDKTRSPTPELLEPPSPRKRRNNDSGEEERREKRSPTKRPRGSIDQKQESTGNEWQQAVPHPSGSSPHDSGLATATTNPSSETLQDKAPAFESSFQCQRKKLCARKSVALKGGMKKQHHILGTTYQPRRGSSNTLTLPLPIQDQDMASKSSSSVFPEHYRKLEQLPNAEPKSREPQARAAMQHPPLSNGVTKGNQQPKHRPFSIPHVAGCKSQPDVGDRVVASSSGVGRKLTSGSVIKRELPSNSELRHGSSTSRLTSSESRDASSQEREKTFVPPPNLEGTKESNSGRRQKLKRGAKSRHRSLAESEFEFELFPRGEEDLYCKTEPDPEPEPAGELDEFVTMTPIKHLTYTSLCKETGLPIQKLSVLGGTADETIFDFQIKAKPSNIPNAGMGAFLTFLGTRVLKAEKKERGELLLEYRNHANKEHGEEDPRVLTRKPLKGILYGDHTGFNIKFAGENNHAGFDHGNPFVLRQLVAGLPGGNRQVGVRLVSSDARSLYEDDELEGLNPSHDSKRIGLLGIHEEEDYEPDAVRTFSSLDKDCGVLDLGVYGPFRRSDRKMQLHFDIKSFIFSHEPNEWCFGSQDGGMIDITSDLTGKPHEDAKRHIPMYVNEVGHSETLEINVKAADDDNNAVHYYACISKPMKAGETVELLVNYGEVYEDVRERKGYGKININEGAASDDDPGSLFKRNFDERETMEEEIGGIRGLSTLFYLSEYLDSMRRAIRQKVDMFIRQAFQHCADTSIDMSFEIPTAQQFVALRRLQWIGQLLLRRWKELNDQDIKQPVPLSAEFKNRCCEIIQDMKWETCKDLMALLDRLEKLRDSTGKPIKRAFEMEIVEEVCYKIRDRLQYPLVKSLWCGIARELTITLSKAVADLSLTPTSADDRGYSELLAFALKQAQSSSAQVQAALSDNSLCRSLLTFESGVHGDERVKSNDWKAFTGWKKYNKTFFTVNTTTPKGFSAAILQFQNYADALSLSHEKCSIWGSKLGLTCPKLIVVAKPAQPPQGQPPAVPPAEGPQLAIAVPQGQQPMAPATQGQQLKMVVPQGQQPAAPAAQGQQLAIANLAELQGYPRALEASSAGSINDTWYIINQVVYVVNAYGELLARSGYSLELLCSALNVNLKLAEHSIRSGIVPDDSFCQRKQRKSERSLAKRRSNGNSKPRHRSSQPKTSQNKAGANGPPRRKVSSPLFRALIWPCLERELNWSLEVGNRPRDFYYVPPGVVRGKGAKNRVDFFDSVQLVISFLEQAPSWKDRPEVKRSLELYEKSMLLADELRRSKKLPKFEDEKDMANYFKKMIQAENKSSHDSGGADV